MSQFRLVVGDQELELILHAPPGRECLQVDIAHHLQPERLSRQKHINGGFRIGQVIELYFSRPSVRVMIMFSPGIIRGLVQRAARSSCCGYSIG